MTTEFADRTGVEASDINDGDILAATKRRTKDGVVQLVYHPPNGEEIVSDWIKPEFVSKAAMGWVEGVRNTLVERARMVQERARSAELARQRDMPPLDAPEPPRPAKPAPQWVDSPSHDDGGNDPGHYALQQWQAAKSRLESLRDAEAAYKKWTIICEGLGVMSLSRDTDPESD